LLPADHAKKKYLRSYESGWSKMHEMLIKTPDHLLKQTLSHLKNFTDFQCALVPAEMNNLLEMRLQKY